MQWRGSRRMAFGVSSTPVIPLGEMALCRNMPISFLFSASQETRVGDM